MKGPFLRPGFATGCGPASRGRASLGAPRAGAGGGAGGEGLESPEDKRAAGVWGGWDPGPLLPRAPAPGLSWKLPQPGPRVPALPLRAALLKRVVLVLLGARAGGWETPRDGHSRDTASHGSL